MGYKYRSILWSLAKTGAATLLLLASMGANGVFAQTGAGEPRPVSDEGPEGASGQNRENAGVCAEGYGHTPVSCTIENRKMVRHLDTFGFLITPLLGLIGVFAMSRWGQWWWITDWRKRITFIAGSITFVSAILLLGLPILAERGLIAPQTGFVAYLGLDPSYLPACRPCQAEVTNENPFWGQVSFGMNRNGLAILQPFALLFACFAAAVVWSAIGWGISVGFRMRRGVDALASEGRGQ